MTTPIIDTCYGCGGTYIQGEAGDNFCSDRCAAFIAQGGVPRHLQTHFISSRRGVKRQCVQCRGQFESLGLKMCPACYRRHGHKADFELFGKWGGRDSAAGAAKKIRATPPAIRICKSCGDPLPRGKSRFCSTAHSRMTLTARARLQAQKAAAGAFMAQSQKPSRNDGSFPGVFGAENDTCTRPHGGSGSDALV